jgi:PAS domain S-box-containing protein
MTVDRQPALTPIPDSFLAGAGEMGVLVRTLDWGQTPLGPLAFWPQSLRTTMSICLNSRFPIAVYWGPEYLMLYNQSLVPMVGPNKHPQALAQPAKIVLAEIWNIIEPLLRSVRETGQAIWSEDLMLPLARTGTPEESYFTFTYSPIRDESEGIGGVFCAVIETTDNVIEGRRLRLLNALAEARRAISPADACIQAAAIIAHFATDVPFVLLYLQDESGLCTLAASSHIDQGPPFAVQQVRPGEHSIWRLDEIKGEPLYVTLEDAPGGARGAVVLPMELSGTGRPAGFVVAGLNPLLAQSASYTRFHTLLASSISQGVTAAALFEQERRRAEALAELDRAKTAFFSNVSHELRTPLTLMLAPAEDALSSGETLSILERERWSLVHRNALRLSKLVNTLLDFSRIEAGRARAAFEPTDLSAFTADLASVFRSAIERGELQFVLDLPALPEPAYVDREMWEKIVLNLLSNALKFTFTGEIAISLKLVGSDFQLTVRDTGIGIAAEQLPHIFDRFHRITGARARTHEGTGIGLALVAELVKLHDGRIEVQSTEGVGSEFHVLLPRGPRQLDLGHPETRNQTASVSDGSALFAEEALQWGMSREAPVAGGTADLLRVSDSGPRARIVLADDNADMRAYVARLLREQWDVDEAGDGEDALARIESNPPDLVLADVMMPGLDGFGLLRAIRAHPALRFIPVILLSARAGEEATSEGLIAGANDYIVKPFSSRELLVRVASRLASAKLMRQIQTIEAAARRRLYGHFMQAPFPIAVLRGSEHVLELANPRALKAWGKDEGIFDKPIAEGIPELRDQPFVGYLDQVLKSGVAYEARGELARLVRSSDGRLEDVYWDFVYAPLRDADGSIDGVLVAGFEVTPQVLAAQQTARLLASAEASERQFRELVENLPELAWTARPEGVIDFYNRRWYEYTGTTPAQMLRDGWQHFLDPALHDEVIGRWQRSISTGEPFEMEFPLRGADGAFRWFLTRVKPLHNPAGHIVRWFGSSTDIDDRRRVDDFREIFLGILGHDLRNPLHAILTTAQVLTRRPESWADAKQLGERIIRSGVRMQHMIEQLLDLTRARLTAGIAVTLSSHPVDVAELVSRISDEARSAHPHCTIEINKEGNCFAQIDSGRFEQVVSNLLTNALTHGDHSIPIKVFLSGRANTVTLTVSNHGKPIDPAFLPLIFSPFARSETSGSSAAGLGLGLYISERIIHAHGGTLSVQSSQELGTRFEVVLPRHP